MLKGYERFGSTSAGFVKDGMVLGVLGQQFWRKNHSSGSELAGADPKPLRSSWE